MVSDQRDPTLGDLHAALQQEKESTGATELGGPR